MNFFAAFATMIQLLGAASFPDDQVTWQLANSPLVYDAQTGVIAYTATPSAPVGCSAPRFTVDTGTACVLAVHCLEADGSYGLLFTGACE